MMVWQTVVGKKEKNGLIFLKLKSKDGNIYPVQVAPGVDVPDHKGLMFADVLLESWVVKEVKTKENFEDLGVLQIFLIFSSIASIAMSYRGGEFPRLNPGIESPRGRGFEGLQALDSESMAATDAAVTGWLPSMVVGRLRCDLVNFFLRRGESSYVFIVWRDSNPRLRCAGFGLLRPEG